MAAKQGSTSMMKLPDQTAAAAGGGNFDPTFECIDNAASYVLRLDLQGFKKDDFRVQVDSAGRLTVRGTGKHAAAPRFLSVFQLPPAASLDDISGRLDAGVLTLTVPKAAAPTTVADIKKPKPAAKEEGAAAKPPPKELVDGAKQQKDDGGADKKEAAAAAVKPKEEITKDSGVKKKEESSKKAMDETAAKVQPRQDEEQMHTPAPPTRTGDHVKPKAPSEKAKAATDRERVRRRAEEERAKAAADEAEREKKTACGGWKERVAGELADMKWADDLVEMARKNKEVVAAAIVAFSLGFLVSQKLLSRK